jgi:hypothetical protein
VITISINSFGQADADSSEFSSIKVGAYYNSNLNYYGRTDSLKSSGFFPLVELWFTKNLYINAAPVFVNNKMESFQYAGTIATAGLQFINDHIAADIHVLKPFYKENSQLVQSALKAQAAAEISFLSNVLNFTIGSDIKFSDKKDYGVTAGLDHIFKTYPHNGIMLAIVPSAEMYAGTQQFTNSYLKKTRGSLLFPGREQIITESSQRFNVLSYEFSMPVILTAGKFQLLASPAYIIPKNLLKAEDQQGVAEKGNDMFYITLGAKLSF